MRPGHVPYGYRIKDGVGVICEEEAENIRKMFEMYLDGSGLQAIADTLGLDLFHGGVSRIISNGKYLGPELPEGFRELSLGRPGANWSQWELGWIRLDTGTSCRHPLAKERWSFMLP